MKMSRAVAVAFALGSLAVLPACSMMGGGGGMMGGGSTAAAAPTPSLGQPGLSPSTVRQVQTALQQQGAYKGNIDGVWGEATRTAVRNYQQAHSLKVNGELYPQTLQALNIVNTGTGNTAGNTGGTAPGSNNPPAVSGGTTSGGTTTNTPPASQTNQ